MGRRPTLFVEYRGGKHALAELCREHGLSFTTVNSRIKSGMPVEQALTEPTNYPKKRRRRPDVGREPRPSPREKRNALKTLFLESRPILRDTHEVLQLFSVTPRHARLRETIRGWLQRADKLPGS